jgi:hypothetical protein
MFGRDGRWQQQPLMMTRLMIEQLMPMIVATNKQNLDGLIALHNTVITLKQPRRSFPAPGEGGCCCRCLKSRSSASAESF